MCGRLSIWCDDRVGDVLEDRQEAHEEVVLDHPHRQLVRVSQSCPSSSPRSSSQRTTTWWLAERNSESRLELDELLAEPDALVVAQVVLEEQHLLDPLDALDGLEQLEHVGRVEVGVERPARRRRARRSAG